MHTLGDIPHFHAGLDRPVVTVEATFLQFYARAFDINFAPIKVYLMHMRKETFVSSIIFKSKSNESIFVAFVEDNAAMGSIRYFENRVSYFV